MKKLIRFLFITAIGLLMSACSTTGGEWDGAPNGVYLNPNDIPNAVPHELPLDKAANRSPYVVDGVRYYVLKSPYGYDEKGVASWYGTYFHGHDTSTGERYDLYGMTAASKVLPIPCYVEVINLRNHRSAIVKVNDRGPFEKGRLIDLSYAAAVKLEFANQGTAPVEVIALNPAGYNAHHDQKHPYPPPRTTAREPQLYLQVAAFKYPKSAALEKSHLDQITTRPTAIYHLNGRYLVLVGPLPNRETMERVKTFLKKKSYPDTVAIHE